MLQNLSPEAIETIAQIIFAVILLIASALGIKFGFSKKEAEGDLHEIKGAIISDAKANEIVRVTEDNTQSNRELVNAIHLLRENVKDAKQEIKDIMRDFKEDLRYIVQNTRR